MYFHKEETLETNLCYGHGVREMKARLYPQSYSTLQPVLVGQCLPDKHSSQTEIRKHFPELLTLL